jgi:hypothetical protein
VFICCCLWLEFGFFAALGFLAGMSFLAASDSLKRPLTKTR